MAIVQNADVIIADTGSIVQFYVCSPNAQTWFDENVESEGWQWLGNVLNIDSRFADGLVEGLVDNGFLLAWS